MACAGQRRRLLVGYFAITALTLAIIDGSAYLFGRTYLLVRAPFLLYAAPTIDRETWIRYLDIRDRRLGWPNRESLATGHYDRSPPFRSRGTNA